jgi:hypothetical protein
MRVEPGAQGLIDAYGIAVEYDNDEMDTDDYDDDDMGHDLDDFDDDDDAVCCVSQLGPGLRRSRAGACMLSKKLGGGGRKNSLRRGRAILTSVYGVQVRKNTFEPRS